VIGPGQGRYGLRGLGQGDLEAEGLDLADVVTELTAGVEAGLVAARAPRPVYRAAGSDSKCQMSLTMPVQMACVALSSTTQPPVTIA
jgi:hypothetical protein